MKKSPQKIITPCKNKINSIFAWVFLLLLFFIRCSSEQKKFFFPSYWVHVKTTVVQKKKKKKKRRIQTNKYTKWRKLPLAETSLAKPKCETFSNRWVFNVFFFFFFFFLHLIFKLYTRAYLFCYRRLRRRRRSTTVYSVNSVMSVSASFRFLHI